MELNKAAFHFARRSLADEPAFLRGAVVVRADARATFIGGDAGVLEFARGVAVIMAAEDRLEIELVKAVEQIIGVQRSRPDICPEGKMGKENGGSPCIQPRKIFIEPGKGLWGDAGLVCFGSFTGIEPDDLPVAMVEGVIDLILENPLVRGTVGIGEIIVIADNGVTRNAKGSERLFNYGQLRWRAVVGEVAA